MDILPICILTIEYMHFQHDKFSGLITPNKGERRW
jgi:hypothetical protein